MDDSFSILVVEDDPVTRQMLKIKLTKAGKKVMTAGDGREALELLEKSFFPIVITDWEMPGMNGLELCRAVREKNYPSYIYIVLLTSRSEKEDIIAGLDAGADDYLTKPFNQAELLARIKAGMRVLELEKSLSQAYQEIMIVSITDQLTKCYNRTYLMKQLPTEIKRSRRYGRPLSIVMSDIDHFKHVNDTYGHQAGDLVLKEFTECIVESFRKDIDWMARYGGEEFILVLPETRVEGAWVVAERSRLLVSEKRIIVPISKQEVKVTASFGIAVFKDTGHSDELSAEALIRKADQYLYRAKKEGRNRVAGESLDKEGNCEQGSSRSNPKGLVTDLPR